MDAKDRYKCQNDHDLLIELAIRTENLPGTINDVVILKRDRWWLFTLAGAAFALGLAAIGIVWAK